MACSDLVGYKPSSFRQYLCSLTSKPRDYTDSWSGSKVTFGWMTNSPSGGSGYCPNRPAGDQVVTMSATAPKGYEAMVRAERQALLNHCELSTGPILPPPPPPPLSSPAPSPASQPVQYTGPMLASSPPPPPPGIQTQVPAPDSVPIKPVVTETTMASYTPLPIQLGPGSTPTGPTLPPGFQPIGPGNTPSGINWGDLIDWGTNLIGGLIGGGETPTSPGVQPTGLTTPGQCPQGYQWNGQQCVATGFAGTIQQWLPGGQTGTMQDQFGQAVMGGFGIPAMVPAQVGTINGGPILRCPTGAVLGKDNLCYQKGSIPNKHRKWPKGPRPLLTGGEMKTLRKVKSLENKVKRAWTAAGKPGQRTCRRK